ncbi:hypothetical protein BV20DRAFT_905854, partial [Pilatotrama ljubarskyi]
LRTSDRVHFRVHSQILAQASPFFSTMLELPQPTASGDAQTEIAGAAGPVVDVPEDGEILELRLRLVYLISKPELDDRESMVPALKAALRH